MLILPSNYGDIVPVRSVVPSGVIDDFERDDGWPGDRPATCLNMYESMSPDNPPYLKDGNWQGTPPDGYDAGACIYLGPGAQSISFEVENASSLHGDQNYWVVQLLKKGLTDPDAYVNLQLEVSQRNSFLVNYYSSSAIFPNIYDSGGGMPYGAIWRWFFTATPLVGGVGWLIERENIDGSAHTTVMSGSTSTFAPDGEFMLIQAAYGTKFRRFDRLGSQTDFGYTGGIQSYTVPPGVTSLTVEAWGAQGGFTYNDQGGHGAYVKSSIPVTPGETLYIFVGGNGDSFSTPGWNGGGHGADASGGTGGSGGGATDIRRAPYGLADRLVVAAGGGGRGSGDGGRPGGDGGITTGSNGLTGYFGMGGTGGTQTAGGVNGGALGLGGDALGPGSVGVGFSYGQAAGGGGGGYYGGGGGTGEGSSGGGGSSHTSGTLLASTAGARSGHGRLKIS